VIAAYISASEYKEDPQVKAIMRSMEAPVDSADSKMHKQVEKCKEPMRYLKDIFVGGEKADLSNAVVYPNPAVAGADIKLDLPMVEGSGYRIEVYKFEAGEMRLISAKKTEGGAGILIGGLESGQYAVAVVCEGGSRGTSWDDYVSGFKTSTGMNEERIRKQEIFRFVAQALDIDVSFDKTSSARTINIMVR
jgi:hypothetical protein